MDDFSQLLDQYLARLQAGDTIDRLELEEEHPREAEQLWRQISAWKGVDLVLPGAPPPGTGSEAHGKAPAIRFHSAGGAAAAEDLLQAGADPAQLARRIAERGEAIGRYRVVEEIARGAMGAILRVVDVDLGRELAMKVMLGKQRGPSEETRSLVPGSAVARFVEEARITSRLAHPGIPPVHDFGVDSEGNFYFTMPWVRGHTLRDVFRRVRSGDKQWSRARALGLLMQVCDTLAYAHAQGFVHRDIKPRNVMVGEFGEVYVMDWGLARDLSRADAADIRIATPDKDDGSPVVTRDGVVLGTPCYMSPEQARGEVAQVGPRTDVYALGAILYELLTGHPPYAPHGSKTPAYGVVQQVQSGPPVSVIAESEEVPGELAAICEKAMAREPGDRFADVGELARELRAFLEGRVVRTYATGAWVEFKKWVGRNRSVAVLAGVLLVALLSAGAVIATVESSRRTLESARRSEMQRSLDVQTAQELLDTEGDLVLVGQEGIDRMQTWLAAAEDLGTRHGTYAAERLQFELQHSSARTAPDPDATPPFDPRRRGFLQVRREYWQGEVERQSRVLQGLEEAGEVPSLQREVEILEQELIRLESLIARQALEWSSYRQERYVDPSLDRVHRRLWDLDKRLWLVLHPEHGAIARVRRELELTKRANVVLEQHAADWDAAMASIADPERCPLYGGLALLPQPGLLPLGRNAAGLWEFWLVRSGERPEATGPGFYEIRPETGMVLVLIPGGERVVGAQSDDPDGPNYVPLSSLATTQLKRDEDHLLRPNLRPYFLSKYEMTQAQWIRLTGSNTSREFIGTGGRGKLMISPTHPVEHVDWNECEQALRRWGLELPTEAQWEVAARGGAEGPFWWGAQWPPPEGAANFRDARLDRSQYLEVEESAFDDGYLLHAPVGTMSQNPWGLHDVTGNVAEWCRDWYLFDCYEYSLEEGTGEILPQHSSDKVVRGGSFVGDRTYQRLSRRLATRPDQPCEDVGLRPLFVVFD